MEPVEKLGEASASDRIQGQVSASEDAVGILHFDHLLGPEFLHGLRLRGLRSQHVLDELQEGQFHNKGETAAGK